MNTLYEPQMEKAIGEPQPKGKMDGKANLLRKGRKSLCFLGPALCYLVQLLKPGEIVDEPWNQLQLDELNHAMRRKPQTTNKDNMNWFSFDDDGLVHRKKAASELLTSYS